MKIFKYGQLEINYLKEKDEKLGTVIDRLGIIEREVFPDLFSALINSIIGQQISSKAAATVWSRLQNSIRDISPEAVNFASPESIQQCGMSAKKAGYIKGIAEAVIQGRLNLESFHKLTDNEIIGQLVQLNGIGKWTAEMFLIFSMERPNVLSWGDYGIKNGIMKLYGIEALNKKQFDNLANIYSPYATIAAFYLWEVNRVDI